MKYNLFSLAFITLLGLKSIAQTTPEKLYLPYDATVTSGSRILAFPWAGGANNPQLSMADLNRDGIQDLIFFDEGAGVRTFLNTSGTPGSPKYVYHPEFQVNFPQVNSYLKMYDYNGDKIQDLFFRGYTGVTPYRGYYNSQNQLCFDVNTKFAGFTGLKYLLFGKYAPVTVPQNDMPAFGDVDGDGDMDIITYETSGTNIYYYRNCAKEEGLPLDSIKICVKDLCWGKTAQLNTRNILTGIICGTSGVTCKGCDASSANKTTHAGNTLCLIDMDGDGDMDLFNGNVSFSDIQFTKNGRIESNNAVDSMIAVDTMWGAHGKIMYMPQQPCAYYMDLDNDGKKDLAFTPYLQGSENYKCISYYKNIGTATKPDFMYQSDTLFMQDMIDVGTASAPVFYDYNKDGKPDLFVGGEGLYQAATGTFLTSVFYYENTSTVGSPSFTLKTKDFMSLSTSGLKGAALAMGDLDGDSKDDLLIGQTDGTVLYYHNNAASALVSPQWQNPHTLNDLSGTLDVGDYAAPCIYDIDKDGKKDIVMGSQVGKLTYYRNSGGAVAPAYQPLLNKVKDSLGGVLITELGSTFSYTSPYIGKIDNLGKDYLLIGSGLGIIYKYDNFQSGSLNAVYTRIDSGYSGINVYSRAKPAVADIDGDGRYEMVVGDQVGGVFLYHQFFNVGIDDKELANGGVKIYPNPAKTMINIGWMPAFAPAGSVHITLMSVTGQRLYNADVDGSITNAQVDVSGFPSGTYYCIVQSADHQVSSPVAILR